MTDGSGNVFSKLWTIMMSVATGKAFLLVIDQVVLIIEALIVLGTIILVQVYIAIALIVGYIFVPFMIFKPLEFLWNGWLEFLISSSLAYFLIYVLSALMAASLNQITTAASTMNAAHVGMGASIGFLLLMGIFAYLF